MAKEFFRNIDKKGAFYNHEIKKYTIDKKYK